MYLVSHTRYLFLYLTSFFGHPVQIDAQTPGDSHGELYPKPDEPVAPNVYQVAAVLHLNGDGKLEGIVHSSYCQAGQTIIYRCEVDKIEAILSIECGV